MSELKQNGGRWVELLLICVDGNIPIDQTINLLVAMETEVIRVATDLHYDGIVVVNSHPVTMVIKH